jgi:drug/metabolite transporter (DMT)-like permease
MIDWLIVAIIAYVLFGLGSLGDKLVLTNSKEEPPKPKAYTFYVGIFGLLFVLLVLPFIKFTSPSSGGVVWIILDAIVRILGLYTMFVAVSKFDISKVIATIGATQPIFIFILTWFFWGPQTMTGMGMLAFALLFAGSIIISIEKSIKFTADYLKITMFSSLMFSLEYVFSKLIYVNMPFLSAVICIQSVLFLFVLLFLFSKTARAEIFSKQVIANRKNQAIFVGTQIIGGAGNLFQGFAISLAPVVFLATINSLRGIQYALLFIATLLLSYFFPKVLKEELSRKVIFQKAFAILLIIIGLIMLVS